MFELAKLMRIICIKFIFLKLGGYFIKWDTYPDCALTLIRIHIDFLFEMDELCSINNLIIKHYIKCLHYQFGTK